VGGEISNNDEIAAQKNALEQAIINRRKVILKHEQSMRDLRDAIAR
jgi:hypothetical protein